MAARNPQRGERVNIDIEEVQDEMEKLTAQLKKEFKEQT